MAYTYNDIYEPPEVIVSLISGEHIICASPPPGGNEGVNYEDWGD